jgi:hydroxyacylglutathione hydrolase
MHVQSFSGGLFAENCYLAVCESTGQSIVIDPGAAADGIARAIEDGGSDVQAIVLTHAHLDHIEGIARIREVTDAPIWLHPADRPLYDQAPAQAAAFGVALAPPPPPDRMLEPETPLSFGDCTLEVRFTPGHAPGHVILYSAEDGLAFCGDVVFAGSIGRTDLPGGDFRQLMDSIRSEVLTLPDDTRLLTGHGPPTTVGHERVGNPFLAPNFGGGMA